MSWLERLPALGWPTAAVFVQRDGRLADVLRAKGVTVETGSGQRFRNMLAYVGDVGRLVKLIRRTQPSLVYSSGAKAHIYGGTAAILTSTSALWFAHDRPGRSLWVSVASRIPGRLYANSAGTAEAFREVTGNAPEWVYPPIEVDRFQLDRVSRAKFRAGIDIRDDEVLFGYVGRLQRQKGVEIFIEALAAARAEEPTVRGVVIGSALQGMEADYVGELIALASTLSLGDRDLRFLPFQLDPIPAMSGIDCLVLTSVQPEPWGMVIVEAMAAGRRVIAAAEGGPLETVTAETGDLVPARNVNATMAAILHVARNAALREQAEVAGPRRARDFDAAKSSRNLANAFAATTGRLPDSSL